MSNTLKFGKTEMTEEEFERQFEEATRRGAETLAVLPKATSVKYDAKTKRIRLNMQTGTTLLVPVSLIQGLQTDDEKALSDVKLMIQGSQIHWDTLDVQFYVKSLLNGIFGTQKWMNNLNEHLTEIGRKGGSARTEAKRKSSATNGQKGGRPRKNVA